MTEEKFAQILALGHETTGVEFKGPGSRADKSTLAGVARAVLGMANRRDGGQVIVGIIEHGNTLIPKGLTEADSKTWRHEDVSSALAAYADPYVEVHTELFKYQEMIFAIINVDEFREVPVLCKKPFDSKLRDGACYVRRRGRIETSEIPTQAEMRDLLELATEKRLREFLRQARRAGLAVHAVPSDADLFDTEFAASGTSTVVDKIQSKGYWHIRVRPSEYNSNRIDNISTIHSLVQRLSVNMGSMGGWDFPHVEENLPPIIDQSYVAQEVDWANFIESWRFYQSGQFAYIGAIATDWPSPFFTYRRRSSLEPEGPVLLIEEAIARYEAALEFAARLSASPAGSARLWLEIGVHGLKGRHLRGLSFPLGISRRPCMAHLEKLVRQQEFTREQLLSESREIALDWVRELFRRFNWDPEVRVLEGLRR
jgi:hypothetical protein